MLNKFKSITILFTLAVACALSYAHLAPQQVFAEDKVEYLIVNPDTGKVVNKIPADEVKQSEQDMGSVSVTTPLSQENKPATTPSSKKTNGIFYPINIIIPKGFFNTPSTLINSTLNLVIIVSALLVFVFLLWGGIEWIVSGGDKGKTDNARNKITSAIIGLIVVAASWAILTIILNFLGYTGLEDVINQNMNGASQL